MPPKKENREPNKRIGNISKVFPDKSATLPVSNNFTTEDTFKKALMEVGGPSPPVSARLTNLMKSNAIAPAEFDGPGSILNQGFACGLNSSDLEHSTTAKHSAFENHINAIQTPSAQSAPKISVEESQISPFFPSLTHESKSSRPLDRDHFTENNQDDFIQPFESKMELPIKSNEKKSEQRNQWFATVPTFKVARDSRPTSANYRVAPDPTSAPASDPISATACSSRPASTNRPQNSADAGGARRPSVVYIPNNLRDSRPGSAKHINSDGTACVSRVSSRRPSLQKFNVSSRLPLERTARDDAINQLNNAAGARSAPSRPSSALQKVSSRRPSNMTANFYSLDGTAESDLNAILLPGEVPQNDSAEWSSDFDEDLLEEVIPELPDVPIENEALQRRLAGQVDQVSLETQEQLALLRERQQLRALEFEKKQKALFTLFAEEMQRKEEELALKDAQLAADSAQHAKQLAEADRKEKARLDGLEELSQRESEQRAKEHAERRLLLEQFAQEELGIFGGREKRFQESSVSVTRRKSMEPFYEPCEAELQEETPWLTGSVADMLQKLRHRLGIVEVDIGEFSLQESNPLSAEAASLVQEAETALMTEDVAQRQTLANFEDQQRHHEMSIGYGTPSEFTTLEAERETHRLRALQDDIYSRLQRSETLRRLSQEGRARLARLQDMWRMRRMQRHNKFFVAEHSDHELVKDAFFRAENGLRNELTKNSGRVHVEPESIQAITRGRDLHGEIWGRSYRVEYVHAPRMCRVRVDWVRALKNKLPRGP